MTGTDHPARRPVVGPHAATLFLVLAVTLGLAPAGCSGASGADVRPSSGGQNGQHSGGGGTLTVFAAASLTDAFTELGHRFEESTGATVRISFAGSSTLAGQIQRGAPAEVFVSANEAQMDRAASRSLVAYGPKVFAESQLVVLVPDENPANIDTFRELADPGVRFVLAAQGVPVAEYAKRVLDDAAARYGPRFRQRVLGNLVSREADVRSAVNRVVLGDADATIAYASDVTPDIRQRVRIVEIPPRLNVIATYHMAALTRADSEELARRWVNFVFSDAGRRVLREWGFQPARPQ